VARADGERKQISTTASTIVTIAIGLAVGYLGVTMVRFGLYALGEGEALIGMGSTAVGAVFVAAVLAVLVSQLRAWSRARR
jgi:predicted exporter